LSFGRLLLLKARAIEDKHQLSRLLGQSEKLTAEYLEIYERHKEGVMCKLLIGELITFYESQRKNIAN